VGRTGGLGESGKIKRKVRLVFVQIQKRVGSHGTEGC